MNLSESFYKRLKVLAGIVINEGVFDSETIWKHRRESAERKAKEIIQKYDCDCFIPFVSKDHIEKDLLRALKMNGYKYAKNFNYEIDGYSIDDTHEKIYRVGDALRSTVYMLNTKLKTALPVQDEYGLLEKVLESNGLKKLNLIELQN